MRVQSHIFKNTDQTVTACAQAVVDTLADAIEARGIARIALAGGNTPRRLYHHISQHQRNSLDWSRVEFYFGDERNVPPDHPDSNYLMAQNALFLPLDIPRQHIYPLVSGQNHDPQLDADAYERNLTRWASGPVPCFDLCLLGMGSDGHFASIFPDTPAEHETRRLVMVNPVEKINTHRLTLTFPVFEQARNVYFLITGADKQPSFARILAGENQLPAESLCQRRTTDWFVDPAAAGDNEP